MESQFYQLCKANGFTGTIEANVKLLSRHSTGVRLKISREDAHASIEVTDEELERGGEEAFDRALFELHYRLREVEDELRLRRTGEWHGKAAN